MKNQITYPIVMCEKENTMGNITADTILKKFAVIHNDSELTSKKDKFTDPVLCSDSEVLKIALRYSK